MTRRPFSLSLVPFAALVTISLAAAPDARAGTTTSLAEKVFSADTIVELRTSFNKPVPKKWLARKDSSYPSGYIRRATRLAKVRKVLLAPDGVTAKRPERLWLGSYGSRCFWNAQRKKHIRVLVFMNGGHQISGVEVDGGVDMNIHPDYGKRLAAVKRAITWSKTPSAEQAQEIYQLLERTKNPYLGELALYYLDQHAPALVQKNWGRPHSDQRLAANKKRVWGPRRSLRCRK